MWDDLLILPMLLSSIHFDIVFLLRAHSSTKWKKNTCQVRRRYDTIYVTRVYLYCIPKFFRESLSQANSLVPLLRTEETCALRRQCHRFCSQSTMFQVYTAKVIEKIKRFVWCNKTKLNAKILFLIFHMNHEPQLHLVLQLPLLSHVVLHPQSFHLLPNLPTITRKRHLHSKSSLKRMTFFISLLINELYVT